MLAAQSFWAPLTTLVVVLAWSGYVSLFMQRSLLSNCWRAEAAHVLLGVLIFSGIFGVLVELRASAPLATALLGVGTVLGLVVQAGALRKHRERIKPLAVISAGVVMARAAASVVPVNPQAVDPYNYAFGAAAAFSDEWLRANALSIPHFDTASYFAQVMWVSRAPAMALVWPLVPIGQGISVNVIFGVALFLLLASWLVLFDTVRSQASPAVAAIVASAGIGALNLISILVGGQINQAFGLFAVVSLLWLSCYAPTEPIFLVGTGLIAFAVSAGYTEMLLALPVYLGGAVLLRGATVSRVAWTGMAATGGALLVLPLTRFETLTYLFQQGSALPTWQPLPSTPAGPLEAWQIIAIGPWTPWWSIVLVAPVAYLILRLRRQPRFSSTPPPRLFGMLVLLGLSVYIALCTWAIFRSPNPNYATFKLNGWLGPAVMLESWVLATSLSGRVGVALCAVVLSVAVVRATTLPAGVLVDLLTIASVRSPEFGWRSTTGSGGDSACVVQAATSEYLVTVRAIAESAAPVRGCRVQMPDSG